MLGISQNWMYTGDLTMSTSILEMSGRLSSALTAVFLNFW